MHSDLTAITHHFVSLSVCLSLSAKQRQIAVTNMKQGS